MVVVTRRTYLAPKGIKNIGNTCFFNASIQCLLSIDELVAFYKGANFSSSMPVSKAFSKFLEKYNQESRVSPEEFISSIYPKIRLFNSIQQDSHEFVVRFLEALHDELSADIQKINTKAEFIEHRSKNIISELFYSFNKQSLTCTSCNNTSETYALHNMVQINVAETTQQGLEHSFGKEKIDGSGIWKCDFCNRSGSAVKQLEVLIYPKVLILCIQRFTSTLSKNTKNISINPKVKLNNNTYYLLGVIKHVGSLNEGHYTAEAKRLGNWINFNDSVTNPCVLTHGGSSPYMLFYSKP